MLLPPFELAERLADAVVVLSCHAVPKRINTNAQQAGQQKRQQPNKQASNQTKTQRAIGRAQTEKTAQDATGRDRTRQDRTGKGRAKQGTTQNKTRHKTLEYSITQGTIGHKKQQESTRQEP